MASAATARHSWNDQFRLSFQEIEISSSEGATALMYACQQENVEQLIAILKKKPQTVGERDRTLKTALHYCAENSSLKCAEIVLNAAPELLDAADEDGYTALHLAVIAGNVLLVNFLLSKNADINKLDTERHSVIHWATVCGEIELLQILLKCGANPSTPDVHGGYPIHYAAQMCGTSSEIGNDFRLGLGVLRVLLNYHVDVNATDHDGRPPLLWAASAGSSDAVLALTNAGASIQAHDKDGLTALHCAASRGHTDCLETLIELCGADVDVIDNNGCSPLFYSVTLGHADATQLLLQFGANANRQDRKGRTPAHCGAAKGQFETLRILKKHNGNLWIRNIRGDYCIHEAVNAGRKDLVKWLLSQRPDAVNSSNVDGRCPLHIAAITNNIEMCKVLLDYQSLVNPVMKTSKGDMMTPLDAALCKSNRGCAKYLQLHGGVPATKLSSYSAALRGPRRMESHSDYHGSPDGTLEAPFQNRNSRSLDTSPCGYQTTKSRTVQVRIEANLCSENIRESNVYSDEIKCTYEKSKRKGTNHGNSYHRSVIKTSTNRSNSRQCDNGNDTYFSNSLDSNSSDFSDRSSENDSRKKRRRRRRQRKMRRKTSENIQKETENLDATNPAEERVHKTKLDEDNDINHLIETTKSENLHTVTALVHREDEQDMTDNKKNGSSENEYQEIQYQKLEVQDGTSEEADSSNANQKVDPDNLVAPENVDVTKKDLADHEEIIEKKIVKEEMNEIKKEENKDASGAKVEPEAVSTPSKSEEQVQKKSKDFDDGNSADKSKQQTRVQFDTSNLDVENDAHNLSDTQKSKTENARNVEELEQNTNVIKTENETTVETTQETGSKTATTEKEDPSLNQQNEELKEETNDDASSIEIKNYQREIAEEMKNDENYEFPENYNTDEVKQEDQSSVRNEFDNSTIDTRSNELFNLNDNFTKDRGLICVILDDDETIEIKRRKDTIMVKNSADFQNVSRAKSETRKTDENSKKIERRSRSSFEVLPDDDEKRASRFTPYDDSNAGSSRKRNEISTMEDASKKAKSKIPRATNKLDKENFTDVNVSSVTQAVQNSLRKYHLERRIFHTLLELKRLQIRAGKSNEQILVKRLVDDYQKAGLIVGLRQYDGIYSFRHFERYLYEQLRILQSANKKDIPRIKSTDDFERLTKALKRTRAVSKIDHHLLPKTNTESYRCFLPRIDDKPTQRKQPTEIAKCLKNVDPSKPVTLELIHGAEKQIISLPTEKLDKNKRYYVTFTIKGSNNTEERSSSDGEKDLS
ncbi:ankycorbin-like isoform X2 [Planococcus citri]|uniref:ankycorbin-like isoform X2 n=1 Tax=Planococcus citri TaxID=170843 RepID=UPI0031F7D04F